MTSTVTHMAAYGVYPNGPSFYSLPGYAQCVYPNGVQYTPFPEVQHYSRPDNAHGAYPYGVTHPFQGAEIRQVDKVLPEQQRVNDFCQQPETEMRQTSERPVVQFCIGATPEDSETRQNFTVMGNSAQHTELGPVGIVYHTKRDDSSYREEPSTEPELRTKERKILQYDNKDLEHDDVSERRHRKKRTEIDTKAGTTRHLSRRFNGTTKQAIDPADAKVGLTQHLPFKRSNSSSQNAGSRKAGHAGRHKVRKISTKKTQQHPDVTLTEKVQGTERCSNVHSTGKAITIVKSHKTLESGAAPSITTKNEGVVPRMWSTITGAPSARSDEDREGAAVPYIPSFSANERSDSTARDAGAPGEARFGDVESIDEWRDPFPILGVAAESADESTTPAPVFQLEHNQLDLSRDSTDGKMIPAGAELMETAELNVNSGRVHPLVDVSLDTAEDYLHQTTGSSGAQTTGSIQAQTTGSSGDQTTGNVEARTAESSEVATTVVPVECTLARAVVYPNSKSVDPTIIIIKNHNRHFPVMDWDMGEEPGSFEQDIRGVTVATGVAGSEQMTRTGHRYTQISRTHEEPVLEELDKTSRKCSHFGGTVVPSATAEAHTCEGDGMPLEGWMTTAQEAQHPGLSGESSARQNSFTKLTADVELEQPFGLSEESSVQQNLFMKLRVEAEMEARVGAEVELESRNELVADCRLTCRDEVLMGTEVPHALSPVADFSEVQEDSDSGSRKEFCEEVKVAEVLPDVRSDKPTSILEVQYDNGEKRNNVQPAWSSHAQKEVLEGVTESGSVEPGKDFGKSDRHVQHTAGPDSVEPDEDYGASDVDTTGPRRSVGLEKSKDEKVQQGRTQAALADSEFSNVSRRIFDTSKWSSERQRPTRVTRRPTRFRYGKFETQFRPEEGRRCNKLGRGDQARSDISNVSNFNKYVKKANVRFRSARGVKQKLTEEINLPTRSQESSGGETDCIGDRS